MIDAFPLFLAWLGMVCVAVLCVLFLLKLDDK